MRYYPSLDSLRALAAMGVLVGHIEVQLAHNSLPSVVFFAPYLRLGAQGVQFFFVLSGFLITQVLLADGLPLNRVALRNFYLRRVFRIWPLYYFTLFLAFFLYRFAPGLIWQDPYLPEGTEKLQALLLSVVFLPNYVYDHFGHLPFIAQNWSIGVEEQFYLFWPLLLSLPVRALGVIAGCLLVLVLGRGRIEYFGWGGGLAPWFFCQPFDALIVGSLFGYWVHQCANDSKHWLRRLVQLRAAEITILSATFTAIFFPLPYVTFLPIRLGLMTLYALVVSVYALSPTPVVRLDFPWLRYLGRISYGIYMYHMFALGSVIALAKAIAFPTNHPILLHTFVTTLGVPLTIGMAAFSWRFIERPFLRWKDTFAMIQQNRVAQAA